MSRDVGLPNCTTLTLSVLAKPRVRLYEFATSNLARAHHSSPTPSFSGVPYRTIPVCPRNAITRDNPPFSDSPSIIVHFIPIPLGCYCIPDRDLPGAHQAGGGRFGGYSFRIGTHPVRLRLLSIRSSLSPWIASQYASLPYRT